MIHPFSDREKNGISTSYTGSGATYVQVPISSEMRPSLFNEIQKNSAEIITELARTVIAVEMRRLLNMVKMEGNLREVPQGPLGDDAISAAVDKSFSENGDRDCKRWRQACLTKNAGICEHYIIKSITTADPRS